MKKKGFLGISLVDLFGKCQDEACVRGQTQCVGSIKLMLNKTAAKEAKPNTKIIPRDIHFDRQPTFL